MRYLPIYPSTDLSLNFNDGYQLVEGIAALISLTALPEIGFFVSAVGFDSFSCFYSLSSPIPPNLEHSRSGTPRGATSIASPMEPRLTITASQKPEGYGRLQSEDPNRHARWIVDAIAAALT